jgi:hypothetical protein
VRSPGPITTFMTASLFTGGRAAIPWLALASMAPANPLGPAGGPPDVVGTGLGIVVTLVTGLPNRAGSRVSRPPAR